MITGLSQGYGFVEMKSEEEARRVLRRTVDATLKGYKIFIDYECGRSLKGWKPRRLGIYSIVKYISLLTNITNFHIMSVIFLGGGFGGKKESGQLRFGGKDRPFKRPIVSNILKPKR